MKDQYIDIVGPESRHCWNVIKYFKAKQEKKMSIKCREKNFSIEIEPEPHGDYKDEIKISVTDNGHQWYSWSLSKQEAEKVVKALKDHFQI